MAMIYAAALALVAVSAVALAIGLLSEHRTNVIVLSVLAATGALILLWSGVARSRRVRRPDPSGGA